VRRAQYWGSHRIFFTVTIAVAIAIVCVVAIAHVMPSGKPRQVNVIDAAAINPLPTTIGFADADTYGMTQADVDKTAAKWALTKVDTVRVMIPWAGVEPIRGGTLNWANVDKVVNAAVAKNLAVMGFINSTPSWAVAPGGRPLSGRPASPDVYADFAVKVAQRYQGKIAAYEIWNEPNAITFYTPTPDPAGYTDLLKAAYPKMKAVDPSITIIGGVLGAVIDFGSATINPVRFVNEMYAAGAKDYFDALSFHPYHYTLKFSEGVPLANSPVNQLIGMRQAMVTNGDSAKKIWCTEYGEPTSKVSEADQGAFIKDILLKWQEMPYTGPLLIYTTRDRATGSADAQDTFGVYHTDWTPKPAQQFMLFAPGKSLEFTRFAKQTSPALGEVLSPVFRATPTVWAQIRSVSTLYETPKAGMFIASPSQIAQLVLPKKVAPTTQFTNGMQEFENGIKAWWSQATGAHWLDGQMAAAYVPTLGLATSDKYAPQSGTARMDFEHGYITWAPFTGVKVVLT
jgi:polysaccharide biosynthesis protein PslG